MYLIDTYHCKQVLFFPIVINVHLSVIFSPSAPVTHTMLAALAEQDLQYKPSMKPRRLIIEQTQMNLSYHHLNLRKYRNTE